MSGQIQNNRSNIYTVLATVAASANTGVPMGSFEEEIYQEMISRVLQNPQTSTHQINTITNNNRIIRNYFSRRPGAQNPTMNSMINATMQNAEIFRSFSP